MSISINDKHERVSIYGSKCFRCKYIIDRLEYKCKAFPKEIPLKYLDASEDHTKQVDGQEGSFVYTPEK